MGVSLGVEGAGVSDVCVIGCTPDTGVSVDVGEDAKTPSEADDAGAWHVMGGVVTEFVVEVGAGGIVCVSAADDASLLVVGASLVASPSRTEVDKESCADDGDEWMSVSVAIVAWLVVSGLVDKGGLPDISMSVIASV